MQVTAHKVNGYSEAQNPGDFYFCQGSGFHRLMFQCPCGCGTMAGISLKPKEANGWDWNGDTDKPTTTPSILINRGHWHGYLTDGVFKEC
jgi:hypothetical protein